MGGLAPSYSQGECSNLTSPVTGGDKDPSSQAMPENQCLNPREVLCGGDESCTGSSEGRMIWGSSLVYDNKLLFRYTVSPFLTANAAVRRSSLAGVMALLGWLSLLLPLS